MTADPITRTLERAGEICADPAPLVYERLFALRPAFAGLFIMDTDGGVRGAMLQTCLESIVGLVEGSPTPRFIIAAARADHLSYGVSGDQFDAMFKAIRDTGRDLLADEWTPDADAAWHALLADIASIA